MKKTILAMALATFGMAAQALTVTSMSIQEIGDALLNDGSAWDRGTSDGTAIGGGHFYFAQGGTVPDGDASAGGADFISDLAFITNGTGQASASGSGAGGPGAAFTSGFSFLGSAFEPYTSGTGLAATYDGGALSIDLSGWGGFFDAFGGLDFPNLAPDGGAGTNGQALIVSASALGEGGLAANNFYYTLDWTHNITAAENAFFAGNVADWHLEGVGTVVPIPAAVWLLGSGLLGIVAAARRRKA